MPTVPDLTARHRASVPYSVSVVVVVEAIAAPAQAIREVLVAAAVE